jgi:hypothetical protein
VSLILTALFIGTVPMQGFYGLPGQFNDFVPYHHSENNKNVIL